jgi:diacylglycerol kinase family enzyme
MTIYSGEE